MPKKRCRAINFAAATIKAHVLFLQKGLQLNLQTIVVKRGLCFWAFLSCFAIQWNPALRTPALYGQFRLSRQKAHIFSLKLTRFIRTPVNTDTMACPLGVRINRVSLYLSHLLYGICVNNFIKNRHISKSYTTSKNTIN